MANLPTVAWIGTGIMGLPMARNLLAAGYPLRVYARRPERLAPLVERGAVACASAAEAASTATYTVVIVADTPDVVAVLTGAGGIIEGAEPGHTVIDMSTISPARTRALAQTLAQRDIALLDAPVSGGETGAVAGTLSIMVGGIEEVYAQALPILEVLGGQVMRIGGSGAGQVAKACNQLIVAQTVMGIAEAFRLAEACDVDPARVREALLGGFGASRALEVHGQRILNDDYAPGFKAQLHNKDLRIVTEEAASHGLNLSGSDRAARLMQALVDAGDGELDSAALAKLVATEKDT